MCEGGFSPSLVLLSPLLSLWLWDSIATGAAEQIPRMLLLHGAGKGQ